MKRNEGNMDRIIRIVLGIAIAAAGVYFQSWLGLIAIIPLATALVGFCPLYAIFGISTCPVQTNRG
ncbi:MAG TPA: DUF2892 domain-containing protein [Aggregatilineales bacterium]|nr:DUF2892 domain-containing protein [Anaerolineae bacterium]HUN08307.1 DUF2892 domain-containing protein [Aggregatilineales bacterium]